MKRLVFRTLIIVSFVGLSISWIITRLTVADFDARIVYISAFLAIFLGAVSIIGSKYFSDKTTERIQEELRKMESRFDEKLRTQYKMEQHNNKKDTNES